jgi:hypothetical protein
VLRILGALVCVLMISSNLYSATARFNISLRILKPTTVSSVQDISFTNTGSGDLKIQKPGILNLKGQENKIVTVSVLENSGETNFTVSGPKSFDSKGNANGIKINPLAGAYAMNNNPEKSLALRIVHQ